MKTNTTKIAYSIQEKHFPGGKIQIQKSANAWWVERIKVQQMINGLKMGFSWQEIALLCGITDAQRKYFFKVHEGLLSGFEGFRQYPNILARQGLYKKLESGNWEAIKFYLERKLPDEFGIKKEDQSGKIILIEDIITD